MSSVLRLVKNRKPLLAELVKAGQRLAPVDRSRAPSHHDRHANGLGEFFAASTGLDASGGVLGDATLTAFDHRNG